MPGKPVSGKLASDQPVPGGLASGQPTAAQPMPAQPATGTDRRPGGTAPLGRHTGHLVLAAFTGLLAIGIVSRLGQDPLRMAFGTVLALGAATPLFLARRGTPLTLAYAATATVGVVLLGNGDARDIVWFELMILTAWCVVTAGVRAGVAAWLATVALFAGEWLWAVHDPGWGPWAGGATVTLAGGLLIRHQLTLVERLRAAQADLAERSAAEERTRIARELHDVIAHGLAVSLLHISSARLALEHDPADAARSLAEAERLGRRSLEEVRATMGVLRSPGDARITPPVPDLAQVPQLVEELRAAGADIELVCADGLEALPTTTGATVYRIVQEALTNATKHAPGAAIFVHLTSGRGTVEVSVDSAGPPGRGSGMGLESMRQRARALGGTCSAGPGGQGWLVRASLPFGAPGPERP